MWPGRFVMRFDHILIADWSAASHPTSATRKQDSIWIGEAGPVDSDRCEHHFRTRFDAETWLHARLTELSTRRVLLGFDFAFAFPAGFARALTGQPDPRAVWRWLADTLTDAPDNANNRFALAASINCLFPAGPGPFWSRPASWDLPDLPPRRHGIDYAAHGLTEHRQAEVLTRAKPIWMLTNPGAVGSQSLMGQALLSRLDGPRTAIWPFDPPDRLANAPLVLAEVYPSLLGPLVAQHARKNEVKDSAQVRLLAQALANLHRQGQLAPLFAAAPAAALEEGWILGASHAELLRSAVGHDAD